MTAQSGTPPTQSDLDGGSLRVGHTSPRPLAGSWYLPLGVGPLAFAVYVVTLSRGVLGGDAGELQFVPPILSLTHPTGYPLQVIAHFLWSYVPVGSVAYRLNLLDAAFAASAVGVVVALVRSLGAGPAGAALAGLSLAFGELWWSQAVRGDKYTLNGLFLALVLWLLVRWRAAPSFGRLAWLAGVYGLSLTHHRSMALVAPALLVGLLLSRRRPRAADLAKAALLAACPLLLYAYLPWAAARGLPPGSWVVDSPVAFVEFLLDRGYTSALRPDAAFQGRLLEEAWVLVRSFGPLGALLGLVGLAALGARRRVEAVVLTLAFVPQAVLAASYLLESNYLLPRHWVFYLPAFLIWSVWLGLGVDTVFRWIISRWITGRRGRATVGRLAPATLLAIVLLAQAGTAWVRGALILVRAEAGAETMDSWRQDFQRSPVAERFGRLAFALAAPDSVIVCDWEQATVLWYFQQIEGQRRDISIVYPVERLDDVLRAADSSGKTVYLSRTLPGIEQKAVPSSVGPLVHLRGTAHQQAGAGTSQPSADSRRTSAVQFDAGFNLDAVLVHAEGLQAGGVLPFTLLWRAERPLTDDFGVSVRLLDGDGNILAAHDERHPALGTSPTSRWPAGQPIGDYRELPLGSRLRAGSYQLQIVPYRVTPVENLNVASVADQSFAVSERGGVTYPVTVEPRRLRTPLDALASLLAR